MIPTITVVKNFPSCGWFCKDNVYLFEVRILRIHGSSYIVHIAQGVTSGWRNNSSRSCVLPVGLVDQPEGVLVSYLLKEAKWV